MENTIKHARHGQASKLFLTQNLDTHMAEKRQFLAEYMG
jgi:hypothetical protein